jgi:hypothetical protein
VAPLQGRQHGAEAFPLLVSVLSAAKREMQTHTPRSRTPIRYHSSRFGVSNNTV